MPNRPVIETLATGDEVVRGDVVDTDSAYVSQRLAEAGLLVARHTAVPDAFDEILAAIREIASRADLCIGSGGLGPTGDDLTADVAARALGASVRFDETAETRMRARFARAGYRFTENNRRSTRVPEGADVYQNEVGTAPAFSATIGRCRFFFLPGVPAEFRYFVDAHVLPWAALRWPGGFGAVVQLKTLGWGESHLAEQFEDFARLFPGVQVGYRAHSPEVWLKLTAEAGSREGALSILAPAAAEAQRRIGETVFGRDKDELDRLAHETLLASGKTLALAESCTGGLVASMLTAHPGASRYLLAGFVTYSNEAKTRDLGVPAGTLAAHGAVSSETAAAMAHGARERTGADLAVAITGIAGPEGGSAEKPVGLVYIAVAAGGAAPVVAEHRFRGDRGRVQRAAASHALNLILRNGGPK